MSRKQKAVHRYDAPPMFIDDGQAMLATTLRLIIFQLS